MLMKGFEEAFKGRPLARLPDELVDRHEPKRGAVRRPCDLRHGKPEATDKALRTVVDEKAEPAAAAGIHADFRRGPSAQAVPVLLKVVSTTQGRRPAAERR